MSIDQQTRSALFPRTRWSLVLRAVGSNDAAALEALGELLQSYWQPLYVFARQSGLDQEDAEDAVQGFCENLIRLGSLQSSDQRMGRLRSYLLGAFQNHLRNIYRSQRRQKRGGGVEVLRLDAERGMLEQSLVDGLSPDVAFERRWVHTLLDRALSRLKAEYALRGRAELIERLEPFLGWKGADTPYMAIADELGMNVNSIRQSVRRMRTRYRTVLEDEIGQTVEDESAIDEERAYLIRVLANA